jgi:hypothetical protein
VSFFHFFCQTADLPAKAALAAPMQAGRARSATQIRPDETVARRRAAGPVEKGLDRVSFLGANTSAGRSSRAD